jgi:hypothetical protein
MRTTAIKVHNNQSLEIFVKKRNTDFELWIVGPMKSCDRAVLDHHLTHDDLEKELAYATPGDLAWHDAADSEIPIAKHPGALEAEETIKQNKHWDFGILNQSVSSHLGGIALLDLDKKVLSAAKKMLIGHWSDGTVNLNIGTNHKLEWSCSERNHPLNIGERIHGHAPDWWNFAMWRLALMNNARKCGTHIEVLRVDEHALHISGDKLNCLVRVFQRKFN